MLIFSYRCHANVEDGESATVLLLLWYPLESWPVPGRSWWVPDLGAFDGCNVWVQDRWLWTLSRGECELCGLRLPAVVAGMSVWLSKWKKLCCGLWHSSHLFNDGHRCLRCPDFGQLKQSWLLFTAIICCGCENNLNLLHRHIKGACSHYIQCRNGQLYHSDLGMQLTWHHVRSSLVEYFTMSLYT